MSENRLWWPSGLERVSNLSKCSLKDPGSNPTWGGLYLIPHHGLQHKVQIMTRTEPLNEDGSPPHCKAQDGGKDGPDKKNVRKRE